MLPICKVSLYVWLSYYLIILLRYRSKIYTAIHQFICHFWFFLVGALTPNGNVSVNCGGRQTFNCYAPGELLEWTTSGLSGISRGPFRARIEAYMHPRITTNDNGGETQESVSRITISGFSRSDNGGIIHCINAENNNVLGMASISVGEWLCEVFGWFNYVYAKFCTCTGICIDEGM